MAFTPICCKCGKPLKIEEDYLGLPCSAKREAIAELAKAGAEVVGLALITGLMALTMYFLASR